MVPPAFARAEAQTLGTRYRANPLPFRQAHAACAAAEWRAAALCCLASAGSLLGESGAAWFRRDFIVTWCHKNGGQVNKMTPEQFEKLLATTEAPWIDFKSQKYALEEPQGRLSLIKDIVAMANTPRSSSSFIILGVRSLPDGEHELLGLDTQAHMDDNEFQRAFDSNEVDFESKPKFYYSPFRYKEKSFGIFEIFPTADGPFISKKASGEKIKANVVYFRKGSTNSEASQRETKEIHKWFDSLEATPLAPKTEEVEITNLGLLLSAANKFDANRLFAFIIGPENRPVIKAWQNFSRLPVSLVFDFDMRSEIDGVLSVVRPPLEELKSVHLLTQGTTTSFRPGRAAYWYAAKGFEGSATALVSDTWREWNPKFASHIDQLIAQFSAAAHERPLTVIVLWDSVPYVRDLLTLFNKHFGASAKYIFAVTNAHVFQELSELFDGEQIPLSTIELLDGIYRFLPKETQAIPLVGLPSAARSFVTLEPKIQNWLEEDLEIVDGKELTGDNLRPSLELGFLKGAIIDWQTLEKMGEAKRDVTSTVIEAVEKELVSRTTARINLYHWPGAGGTTISRRVAWELRKKNPTVLVRNYAKGETLSRFREIFKLTGQSILAVSEGSRVLQDDIEDLYNELRSEQIPAVFLSVWRKFERPIPGPRVFFVDQALSNLESQFFEQVYAAHSPNKAKELNRLVISPPELRTPFAFALTAFEKEFTGLKNYVTSRVKDALPLQKEILVFVALSYFFGHRSLNAQVLAGALGLPEGRIVRLEKFLADQQLELLIQEDEILWRPVHQLVAEELLSNLLSGGSSDPRIWKNSLATWSLRYIEVLGGRTVHPSNELIETVRRIFILRDEVDLFKNEAVGSAKFSKLIEEIPTKEGRLSVLQALAETFQTEPHFWAHLGRFYSTEMKDPDGAIQSLDRALALSPHDSVIYHMKGMALRNITYSKIEKWRTSASKEDEKLVINATEDSLSAFEQARELQADVEHNYISPAQLLIRVIDHAFMVSGTENRSKFLAQPGANWYRDKLDQIEDLLDRAQILRAGDKPSKYYQRCSADLDMLYDNFAEALQGWQNLLSRTDTYKPPVRRQIAKAYLVRNRRNWVTMSTREIERIVDLMEENLREEPTNEHNIRLWFRAMRSSSRQDVNLAIDKMATLRTLGDSRDAYLYLYVLRALKALNGSVVEAQIAQEQIEQSRVRNRNYRDRTKSYEWLGHKEGLGQLVHFSELGEWDDYKNFYENSDLLKRVKGRVSRIRGPEAGQIEIDNCALEAFFVPAVAGVQAGRDENAQVNFFLGFSYDGLRAWQVEKNA